MLNQIICRMPLVFAGLFLPILSFIRYSSYRLLAEKIEKLLFLRRHPSVITLLLLILSPVLTFTPVSAEVKGEAVAELGGLTPKVVHLYRSSYPIEGLWFDAKKSFPIEITTLDNGTQIRVAKLTGRIERKTTNILLNDKKFPTFISSKGDFRVSVPLQTETGPTEFTLTLIDFQGAVFKEQLSIVPISEPILPQATVQAKPLLSPQPSPVNKVKSKSLVQSVRINFGLGLTQLSYSETNITPYHTTLITAKFGADYPLALSRWFLGANTFMNLFPVSSSQSDGRVRMLGANFRAAYTFPEYKGWTLIPMFGVYYTTMMVTNDAFGFSNMFGPQAFLVLKRWLGQKSTISGYGKISPLLNATTVSFQNREIAYGLSFSRLIETRWYSLMLDISQTDLQFAKGVQSVTQTESLSVGTLF